MNREEMVERAAQALCVYVIDNVAKDLDYQPEDFFDEARAMLDAVLPQVTTVAELEALPDGVVLTDRYGSPWELCDGEWLTTGISQGIEPQQIFDGDHDLSLEGPRGPLTVVWHPS